MTEFDVVGVGLNATDTLILLAHFPAYAGKVAFEREILSPGGQVASAMVTDFNGRFLAMTWGSTVSTSFGLKGSSTPSYRRGSGFTPTSGCPSKYFMVFAITPS